MHTMNGVNGSSGSGHPPKHYTVPAAEDLPDGGDAAYDFRTLQAPVLTGYKLRAFVSMLESPMGGALYRLLAYRSNIPQVNTHRTAGSMFVTFLVMMK